MNDDKAASPVLSASDLATRILQDIASGAPYWALDDPNTDYAIESVRAEANSIIGSVMAICRDVLSTSVITDSPVSP